MSSVLRGFSLALALASLSLASNDVRQVVQLQVKIHDFDVRDTVDKGSVIKVEVVNEEDTFCLIPSIVAKEESYAAGDTLFIFGESLGGCLDFSFSSPVKWVRAHYYNDRDVGWWTPELFRVLTSDNAYADCFDQFDPAPEPDDPYNPDVGRLIFNNTYLEAQCLYYN